MYKKSFSKKRTIGDMNLKFIYRILLAAVIAILAVSTTGCGGNDGVPDNDYSALVYMENTPVISYEKNA